MNQKIWSGLTATLLLTTLGIAPSSYANPPREANHGPSEVTVPTGEKPSSQVASTSQTASETAQSHNETAETDSSAGVASSNQPTSSPSAAGSTPSQTASASSTEVVKVGEYQSQEESSSEATIATIQPHEMRGRQAATLYVRNIPVLTFLGSDSASASSSHAGDTAQDHSNNSEVKVATAQDSSAASSQNGAANKSAEDLSASRARTTNATPSDSATANPNDPVWRATTIAARLNQLYRDNVDAEKITLTWDSKRQRYVIKAGDDQLVEMTPNTILPDSTQNTAQDALQATNRIRRQMGNAPPIHDIPGGPRSASAQVSMGPVQFTVRGMASWYGPGFDGGYSASGEVFNQNALTAAHPSLPFGTQVRVTNLDNGESVVVRINDRGPHGGGRIIDLSTGAARVIGLIQSGVAPVNLEVLGAAQTASE
jgi:rare lipoprotein A